MLVISILVVGALPRDIQEKVPLLPTLARPISARAAGAHSAAISSVAGWIRSAFPGRVLVEERL